MAERGKYRNASPLNNEKKKPNRVTTVTNVVKDQSFGQKQWREGLRSRSPSPTRATRDKHATLSSLGKSMDITSGIHSLRQSGNTTLLLEQEYIKSLQQQVYLLELENNHLRQQVMKATEMHPNMTQEAQNMLTKLKEMQTRIDGLELELYRKDGNIDLLNDRISQLTNRLKQETENQSKEKEALLMESVEMRKKKDQLERDVARQEVQINELRDDLAMSQSNLKASESRVEVLRAKLDEEMDTNKTLELLLAEKRSDLLKLEKRLRELEERYYSSTGQLQTQTKDKLQEELSTLQERLKASEMAAENEKYLREKLSRDSSQLVKENTLLNQQILELQRQIEREKSSRTGLDERRTKEVTELSVLREHEKELQNEINVLRRELGLEKQRADRLRHQLEKQTQLEPHLLEHSQMNGTGPDGHHVTSKTTSLKHTQQAPRSDELAALAEANVKLRRDKEYLIEHIETLQKQIQAKDRDIGHMQENMRQLEQRLVQLERLKTLEETLQSRRWGEMERLAESMKSHAHLMAETVVPSAGATLSTTTTSKASTKDKSRVPEAY